MLRLPLASLTAHAFTPVAACSFCPGLRLPVAQVAGAGPVGEDELASLAVKRVEAPAR